MVKVKFANGVIKACLAPTEQKIFKTATGGEKGWVLSLRIVGEITSAELDELITDENIASLEFLSVPEDGGETKTIFTLNGYEKITSSTIRHAEDTASTSVDIQLTKGL